MPKTKKLEADSDSDSGPEDVSTAMILMRMEIHEVNLRNNWNLFIISISAIHRRLQKSRRKKKIQLEKMTQQRQTTVGKLTGNSHAIAESA